MQADNPILRYLNVRRAPRIHPGLLALAALIATVPIYPPNTRLYAMLGGDLLCGQTFMLCAVATAAILGLACTVKTSRNPAWHGFGKRAEVAAGCAYVLGQVTFIAALLNPDLPPALTALSGTLLGSSLMPVTLAWIGRFSADLRSVMVHGALVCALSALLTWMASLLDQAPLIAMVVSLGAVGVFAPGFLPIRGSGMKGTAGAGENGQGAATESGLDAAVKGERGGAPEVGGEEGPQPHGAPGFTNSLVNLLSIIWLPLLGFFIFLFMTNAYEFPSDVIPVSTEVTGAFIASAITLAVSLLHYSTPLVIAVDKLVIPACAALCILLGSFPTGSPAFFLGAASVYAPLIFMSIYAGASVVAVSKAGEFPMPFIVGITVFGAASVSLLGGLVSGGFRDSMNFGQVTWVMVVAYAGVIIMNLGYTSWRKECAPAEADAQPVEEAADVPALRDRLLSERVEELTRAYALTERESQILDYLARGYTSTYIASCLLISANTVRTHMYNTYRKLGVASRAELLALVNE